MADKAKKKQPESRVFTKIVNGKTVTRDITSAEGEIAARFDGFTEQAKSGSSTSSTANTSTGTGGSRSTGTTGSAA